MKEFTCIVCPNGCRLEVELEADGTVRVSGNKCPRGEAFAKSEMTAPVRTISSTVRTVYEETPVLPVKVSSEIPKAMIFQVMEKINQVLVERPLKRGETVIENVCGLGVDVVAASSILKWREEEGTLTRQD